MKTPPRNKIIQEDLYFLRSCPLDWGRFHNKTVLITGASGFLPAYMVELLHSLGEHEDIQCKVIALVRNEVHGRLRFAHLLDSQRFKLLVQDVCEPINIEEKVSFIVHAASQASPKFYGKDPVGTMTANLIGTHHLLNQAREWKVDSFLFFSSGEVYGQVLEDKIPTCERDYGFIDITNLRSCYAESKRAAETLGVSYEYQFGVPFKIVRPFHTYGPGMALDDGRVFADLVSDVLNGRSLLLRSDGNAIRAFCYISDAVRGFFTVLLNGVNSVAYNVGNPDGAISIRGLADLLTGLFPEKNLKVELKHAPTEGYLPSPITINIPNVDQLMGLGWSPTYLPREGFLRTIQSFM